VLWQISLSRRRFESDWCNMVAEPAQPPSAHARMPKERVREVRLCMIGQKSQPHPDPWLWSMPRSQIRHEREVRAPMIGVNPQPHFLRDVRSPIGLLRGFVYSVRSSRSRICVTATKSIAQRNSGIYGPVGPPMPNSMCSDYGSPSAVPVFAASLDQKVLTR
jgi:hypothetical protein